MSNEAATCLRELVSEKCLRFCDSETQALQLIEQVLRQDVRGVKQGRVRQHDRDKQVGQDNAEYEKNPISQAIEMVFEGIAGGG